MLKINLNVQSKSKTLWPKSFLHAANVGVLLSHWGWKQLFCFRLVCVWVNDLLFLGLDPCLRFSLES